MCSLPLPPTANPLMKEDAVLAQAEAPRRFSTLPDSLPSKVISACPALPREFRDFSGPAFQGGQEGKKKKTSFTVF